MYIGMKWAIMITTKNRSSDLSRTLRVLRTFNPKPLEVLVTLDGCTDDTLSVVRHEYPGATLFVNTEGAGSVPARDRMMRETHADLVLALDDDSYPEQLDCLMTIQVLFEKNPKLAIVTFPQRTDEYPNTLRQLNFGGDHLVRSFPCSGACLRVSTYRTLQGFEPIFFHMYEEPDYALQCIANAWEVLFFSKITIRHHWTGSGRSELRNHHRHARNELWSTVIRCPFPHMIPIIVWRVMSQARFAISRGIPWLVREPLWWGDALKGIPAALKRRHPVSWSGYKKWLSLPI